MGENVVAFFFSPVFLLILVIVNEQINSVEPNLALLLNLCLQEC